MTVTILLFLSFLIQPIHQAFANEPQGDSDALSTLNLPDDVTAELPDANLTKSDLAGDTLQEEIVVNSKAGQSETDIDETSESSQSTPNSEQSDATLNDQYDSSSNKDLYIEDIENYQNQEAADSDTNDQKNAALGSKASSSEETTTLEFGTSTVSSAKEKAADVEQISSVLPENYENIESEITATSTIDENLNQSDSANATSSNIDSHSESDTGAEDDFEQESSEPDVNLDSDVLTEENTATNTEDVDLNEKIDAIDDRAVEEGVHDLVDEVVNGVVTLSRQLVTEENFYQFSRQSCVAVGDGAYHCTTNEEIPVDLDSAVYAEKDEDGDMEIFMRTSKGDIKQLSDNDYDDTSPDVDLASMRVVWQRMIDGRYQIISYDLEERVETQLTFSRTNNMEPKASKEGVVWQAWDGKDWEVMFFDGNFTDQITTNDTQDVTPVIEDGYILWSIIGGDKSEAKVYSLESGETMTITGHEGGAVANPRFVLVYDTKFDNGDVVTLGFDPITGLAQPVSAKPAELPFDIPEPDPVGEIRALIQNKSTQKNSDVVTIPVDGPDNDLDLASSTATSSDTLDLHNPSSPELNGAATDFYPDPIFELEENDLVITAEASSTSSSINNRFHYTDSPSGTSTEIISAQD